MITATVVSHQFSSFTPYTTSADPATNTARETKTISHPERPLITRS